MYNYESIKIDVSFFVSFSFLQIAIKVAYKKLCYRLLFFVLLFEDLSFN